MRDCRDVLVLPGLIVFLCWQHFTLGETVMVKQKRKGKKVPQAVDVAPSRPDRERHSVNIRKIKNGYVMSRSGPGIGKNEWDDEETYHATKPTVSVSVADKKARDRRLAKAKL